MKKYELTCLISAEASEEEIQKIQEAIDSIVKGDNLSGFRVDPARRELGDIVAGQKSAKLISVVYNFESKEAPRINQEVKKIEGVMRHILVIKPDIKPDKKAERTEEPKKKTSEKVELGDIDKKIEEILSEQ